MRFAVLLASVVLALAACGEDEQEPGRAVGGSEQAGQAGQEGQAGQDPCALITVEEAEAAAGVPLKSGEEQLTTCTWNAVNQDDLSGVSVTLVPPLAETPQENCDLTHDAFTTKGRSSPEVPGLGLRAWWDTAEEGFQQAGARLLGVLVVCAEPTVFNITITVYEDDDVARERATTLARAVLDRL